MDNFRLVGRYIIAGVLVCAVVLVLGLIILWQKQELETQLKKTSATENFYNMKSLELQLAKLLKVTEEFQTDEHRKQIKELRARGSFIDYLYGVVAFDDAVCVILFSVIFSVVSPLLAKTGSVLAGGGFWSGLGHACGDLFFSFYGFPIYCYPTLRTNKCAIRTTGAIILNFNNIEITFIIYLAGPLKATLGTSFYAKLTSFAFFDINNNIAFHFCHNISINFFLCR